ncbi:uncharacterized protein B0H18DRAFT_874647 [Fomitopsis serialis]|uniref:uncharacterized protein n=1 Tax=Fomitopsis serialis TaxID=139415 RepID=UPI002007B1A7|nr:uncharacterized protein B0H18DRAFT_874647 [Neoantrodia serialis]KAH9928725.1 hypothetical protein B0H18DRAFT_874647 [Neoantrodia serialis]
MFNAVRAAARRVPTVPKPGMAVAPRYYSSSMHDHNADTLDTEKKRNLTGKQHRSSAPHDESAPGWNEYLGSASEAAVKADQSPDDGDVATMQHKTATRIKRRYHEEESPDPNPPEQALEKGTDTSHMAHGENVHAVYERDEVSGPLGGAGDGKSVEVDEVTTKFTSTTTPAK